MDEPSIGIDLGTTNSVVATMVDGAARIIERREGQRLLASMVGYTPEGERVVGEPARQLSLTHPLNVAFATKRLMGQRWTPELVSSYRSVFPFPLVAGPNLDIRVKIAGRAIPVAQIAAAILAELRQDAVSFLGRDVTRAVITVPASFNDAQRQATKEAAQIAGLDVMRLVNEPTAAALAYGLDTKFQGRALVFDLGGGTFDVSILEMRDGVFEVVGTGGDPFLGGEDFDNAIVDWLLRQLPGGMLADWVLQDQAALQQLKTVAERLKRALSSASEVPVLCAIECARAGHPLTIDTTLTRARFEELVGSKVERCLEIVERTLNEAGIAASSVGQIILVGGMTRVPLVRRRVAERFGIEASTHLFPDEVVGLGAAIHAAELVSHSGNTLLLDLVSSSLGVGVAGGLTRVLIPKNKTLPCKVREIFYPTNDGQPLVRIPVVQGEEMYAARNCMLGEVVLDGLALRRRNENAIEVTFELDLDGSLSVTACDVSSGHSSSVKVQARTDLKPQEIERLRAQEGQRPAPAPVDAEERKRNAEIRQAFRTRLISFRKLHSELRRAASESSIDEAQLVVNLLGQRLVEAERLEQTGAVAEVEAMTRSLEELIASLSTPTSAEQPEERSEGAAAKAG